MSVLWGSSVHVWHAADMTSRSRIADISRFLARPFYCRTTTEAIDDKIGIVCNIGREILHGLHRRSAMLNPLIETCTSGNRLFWLVLGSDVSIAIAYFAIPVTMAIVLRDRKDDIPYPWLWILFVTFIVACGLTHLVHASSALAGAEFLWAHAAIGLFCALSSVATAIAFAFILSQIKLLPSPTQQRAQLEKLVEQRTSEKDHLIREINHRIGNQLQIISSMLSLESRNTENDKALRILDRLKTELDKMANGHLERSKVDYLRYGIGAADGTVTPSTAKGVPIGVGQSKPLTA
jgi:hypothetical protein